MSKEKRMVRAFCFMLAALIVINSQTVFATQCEFEYRYERDGMRMVYVKYGGGMERSIISTLPVGANPATLKQLKHTQSDWTVTKSDGSTSHLSRGNLICVYQEYAKDFTQVYYRGNPIANADPGSFRLTNLANKFANRNDARDKNFVYYEGNVVCATSSRPRSQTKVCDPGFVIESN